MCKVINFRFQEENNKPKPGFEPRTSRIFHLKMIATTDNFRLNFTKVDFQLRKNFSYSRQPDNLSEPVSLL